MSIITVGASFTTTIEIDEFCSGRNRALKIFSATITDEEDENTTEIGSKWDYVEYDGNYGAFSYEIDDNEISIYYDCTGAFEIVEFSYNSNKTENTLITNTGIYDPNKIPIPSDTTDITSVIKETPNEKTIYVTLHYSSSLVTDGTFSITIKIHANYTVVKNYVLLKKGL